jgi:hypothetical protein
LDTSKIKLFLKHQIHHSTNRILKQRDCVLLAGMTTGFRFDSFPLKRGKVFICSNYTKTGVFTNSLQMRSLQMGVIPPIYIPQIQDM